MKADAVAVVERQAAVIGAIVAEVGRVIVGQERLVRRMLLIDNQGRIRLTPIAETVQIRGYVAEQEFKVYRQDFLE